jgi:hypothetical protein
MARWFAEKRGRARILAALARELRWPGGPGPLLRARWGLTWRLVPYLSVRAADGGRLRVSCASADGVLALITSRGCLIGLGGGIVAAAWDVAAGCGWTGPGQAVEETSAGWPRR